MSTGKPGIQPTEGVSSLQQDLKMSEDRAQRVRELREALGEVQPAAKPTSTYQDLPDKGRYLDIKV
jgi:hypothetical protein